MGRYEHQITFLGKGKQEELQNKHAVIVGIGGLGSVVAELLARAGIGKITLIDHDIVELSNLQRQSLYDEHDVNKLKAETAKEKLQDINSTIVVESHSVHLNESNSHLLQADIVFDCTDNQEARETINRYCHKKIHWVHCSVAGSKGMVLTFNNSYCFNCIFGNRGLSCQTEGILNTTVYTAASMQVTVGIKILLNEKLENNLLVLDIWKNTLEKIKVKRNPNCLFCQGKIENQEKPFDFSISKCTSQNRLIIKPNKRVSFNLEKIKENYNVLIETPILLVISAENHEIIVHSHGEIVLRDCNDEQLAREIAEELYRLK